MKQRPINWNRRDDERVPAKTKVPAWTRWTEVVLTIGAVALYASLFFLIPQYRQLVAPHIEELPLFSRIVLNIYQPFLIVFILISLSLVILFYLKTKRSGSSYMLLLVLMAVNFVVAAALFIITFVGIE